MAEEQNWQEPGTHRLCANNCGFFGSPTTLNMCSKCYKDHCIKEKQLKDAKLAVEKTLAPAESSFQSQVFSSEVKFDATIAQPKVLVVVEEEKDPVSALAAPTAGAVPQPNMCATCRRRVGITGFKCRCGVTFCGSHRYPEQHGCAVDYKAMGREAIAKGNPVVKAEKLDKI